MLQRECAKQTKNSLLFLSQNQHNIKKPTFLKKKTKINGTIIL